MTELEKIKEKWKKENLDENLNALEEIYVLTCVDNISPLKGWDSNNLQGNKIEKLLKEKLIIPKEKEVPGTIKGQTIYQTTEMGTKIAQELENEIKGKLDEYWIERITKSIPPRLLGFVLLSYFKNPSCVLSLFWVEAEVAEYYGIIMDEERDKIFEELKTAGAIYALKCPYKAISCDIFCDSRKKSESIRLESMFVFSPEIQKKLLEIGRELLGDEEFEYLNEKIALCDFLNLVRYGFFGEGSISEEEIDMIRQEYWSSLEDSAFSEEEVADVINELAKKGITSEYRSIESKKQPFVINDGEKYDEAIRELLIDPVRDYLEAPVDKEQKKSVKREEETTAKKPPEDWFYNEEEVAFFKEIGNFEKEVRAFIVSKLGKNLEKCDTKITDKLKERKKDDELLIGRSSSLIDYAGLEEYISIITNEKEWEKFKGYFDDDTTQVSFPLKFINVYTRKRMAHFRFVTKYMKDKARECMQEFLQKIRKGNKQ